MYLSCAALNCTLPSVSACPVRRSHTRPKKKPPITPVMVRPRVYSSMTKLKDLQNGLLEYQLQAGGVKVATRECQLKTNQDLKGSFRTAESPLPDCFWRILLYKIADTLFHLQLLVRGLPYSVQKGSRQSQRLRGSSCFLPYSVQTGS